jgi:hypothetical protein
MNQHKNKHDGTEIRYQRGMLPVMKDDSIVSYLSKYETMTLDLSSHSGKPHRTVKMVISFCEYFYEVILKKIYYTHSFTTK